MRHKARNKTSGGACGALEHLKLHRDRELRVKVMNFDPALCIPEPSRVRSVENLPRFLLSIVYYSCKGNYVTNEKSTASDLPPTKAYNLHVLIGVWGRSVKGGLKLEEVIGNFANRRYSLELIIPLEEQFRPRRLASVLIDRNRNWCEHR